MSLSVSRRHWEVRLMKKCGWNITYLTFDVQIIVEGRFVVEDGGAPGPKSHRLATTVALGFNSVIGCAVAALIDYRLCWALGHAKAMHHSLHYVLELR